MNANIRRRVVAFVAAGVSMLVALGAAAVSAVAAPTTAVNGDLVFLGGHGVFTFRPQSAGTGSTLVMIVITVAAIALVGVLGWSLERRSRRLLAAVPDQPSGQASDEWRDIGERQSSEQDEERKAA